MRGDDGRAEGSEGSGTPSKGGHDGGVVSTGVPGWWFVATATMAFLFSGLVHEAVGYIAMRRTVYPINTFFLTMTALMFPFWDLLFPVVADKSVAGSSSIAEVDQMPTGNGQRDHPTGEQDGTSVPLEAKRNGGDVAARSGDELRCCGSRVSQMAPDRKGTSSPDGAKETARRTASRGKSRPAMGSWRGWTAVCFYLSAHLPLTLVFHYFLWEWWRWVHAAG